MARRKKKHATVLFMVGRNETTHRGPTLRAALKAAEKSRLEPGCYVGWSKTYRLPSKMVAGGEGQIFCPGYRREEHGRAYWLGVRTNPRGWGKGSYGPVPGRRLRERRKRRSR